MIWRYVSRKHGDFGPERIVQLLILIAVSVFIRNMFKRVIGIHRALLSHAALNTFVDIACNSQSQGLIGCNPSVWQFPPPVQPNKISYRKLIIGFSL